MPPCRIVTFKIEAQRYGVAFESVERVLRLVEYRPLPHAPEIVIGVVDIHGAILPVISLRRRFGLPDREPHLGDHLILARTRHRAVALLVDEPCGIEEVSAADCVAASDILPHTVHLAGVVKRPDGLVFIQDLAACLSLDEEQTLRTALSTAAV